MSDITYPAPAGPLPAYLAVPDGAGPWPGVVVVHDAFGLSRDIKGITDRFAGAGYLATAPALYGRGLRPKCVVATMRSLSNGIGPAVDDLIAPVTIWPPIRAAPERSESSGSAWAAASACCSLRVGCSTRPHRITASGPTKTTRPL